MKYYLRVMDKDYGTLWNHLYPGDGMEAVALALCGKSESNHATIFLIYKVFLIPYNECQRTFENVTWNTETFLLPLLLEAEKKNLAIVKIHSHPGGYNKFSTWDDESDNSIFSTVSAWTDKNDNYGSFVMLPDGKLFGRVVTYSGFISIDKISLIGRELKFWRAEEKPEHFKESSLRNIQAFGEGTVSTLSRLKVAVIGCSGTGSPTLEQLVRLGIGEIVLVDPDKIEEKNLNRILNSTYQDIGKPKVEVLAKVISNIGLGSRVKTFPYNLYDSPEAIKEIISCDFIFGCTDSIDSRHLLNQLSTFYLIPYLDMGVKLSADGKGGIDNIESAIHYIIPGKSSLRTRGVYNETKLGAATLLRTNPSEYKKQKEEKYIENIDVESPAVISINMAISAMAVIDFLDRIHPFRESSYKSFPVTKFKLTEWEMFSFEEKDVDKLLEKYVGRGDMIPFLNMVGMEFMASV